MFKLVTLFLCLSALPAAADRLPGERSLSDTEWGYHIVTSPTRAGAEAQRFEVRPGDCAANGGWDDCARDRERSEFRPDQEWDPGTPQWMSFSVFMPQDFPVSERVKTTIAQIHQRGGPIRAAGGLISRPPVMQMELLGSALRLTVHIPNARNIHVDLAEISALQGVWTDFQVQFDSGPQPVLRVWVNGQLRADVQDWQSPPPDFFYFKYGIYRSFVSRHGGPMPTQVLIFDEVSIGQTAEDVALRTTEPVD